MSSDERPAGLSESERAFLEFLARQRQGEDLSFDDFCAGHPDLAEQLRQHRAVWGQVEGLVETLLGSRANLDLSFARLLDPTDTLQDATQSYDIDTTADTPTELMGRLHDRDASRGRYEDKGVLGSGGMGDIHKVWDADLRRHLAMKVIRKDLMTEGVDHGRPADGASRDQGLLAKFLGEALVTGQLDHPGIPPVHDLGVDVEGRVYFTMKLVRGRTLKDLLEATADGDPEWTVNRIVGVLLRVCEAVAYAHSKGVLHRDLKPANIMVGKYGETYVMDWGLARVGEITSAESGEEGVLGTPVYTSPEQARGELDRADERSDIYSLGAILYHALTLQLPFVGDDELPLRATVLERVEAGDLLPVEALAPDAPPTLVDICHKAMSLRVEDRFRTATEMADLLQDYLEDISEAREEAKRQAQRAQLINQLLLTVLGSGDPDRAQGREVTVREVLDEASRRLDGALEPLDEAALREAIGNIYRKLAQYDEAERHLRKAEHLQRSVRGDDHPDCLSVTTDLALLFRSEGRTDEAEALLRPTLERQIDTLGETDPRTLRTMHILAGLLQRGEGSLQEVEELYRRVIDGRTATLGEDAPETLNALDALAMVLVDAGRTKEAVDLQETTLHKLTQVHGEKHPSTLIAINDLGTIYLAIGQLDQAEALYRRSMDIKREVLGPDHPETLLSKNNLGLVLKRVGQLEEAEALLSESMETQLASLPENHPDAFISMNNLALVYLAQDRFDRAEALLREVIAASEARLGEEHRNTGRFRYNLGLCLLKTGRRAEAVAELERAAAVLRQRLDDQHVWVRDVERALGEAQAPDPAGIGEAGA